MRQAAWQRTIKRQACAQRTARYGAAAAEEKKSTTAVAVVQQQVGRHAGKAQKFGSAGGGAGAKCA